MNEKFLERHCKGYTALNHSVNIVKINYDGEHPHPMLCVDLLQNSALTQIVCVSESPVKRCWSKPL